MLNPPLSLSLTIPPPPRQAIERRLQGRPLLRMAVAKAGPVVTDHGHFLLDVHGLEAALARDPAALHATLITIPGIVDTGLFCGMTQHAYFGQADGSVRRIDYPVKLPHSSPAEGDLLLL